jgi:hypothetical protein
MQQAIFTLRPTFGVTRGLMYLIFTIPLMHPLLSTILITVLVTSFTPPAEAQAIPVAIVQKPIAQVEVGAPVKFSYAKFGPDSWLEAEIELDVKPGGKVISGEFLNRVRITLSFKIEATDSKGAKRELFYKSVAETVALEAGKTRIRFYLPPELVKRDKIKTDIKFYLVELEVDGQSQPFVRSNASNDFLNMEWVKSFQTKVAAESAANDGLLMPQYLTPFYGDAQRPSPTYLRREINR